MYPCSAHIVTLVPHRSPLLLLLCPYIIIVMSALIMLCPLRLLYIERSYLHLYHPRIVHLCNVKEVPPRRGWILRRWSIFSWVGFITFGIRALDSRVLLFQTGHHGISTITFFVTFQKSKKNPFEKNSPWTFKAFRAIFAEIWSEDVGLFTDSWITFKTGDLGKIIITFSLSIGLKFHKKV